MEQCQTQYRLRRCLEAGFDGLTQSSTHALASTQPVPFTGQLPQGPQRSDQQISLLNVGKDARMHRIAAICLRECRLLGDAGRCERYRKDGRQARLAANRLNIEKLSKKLQRAQDLMYEV